jgi:class 3 adenylate cyclase
MQSSASQRKLAAVLAADIVGYSRLMGEDEAGTLAAQKRVFEDAVLPAIETFEGRIVKSMGDGYLVEFDSATSSVSCALDWQKRAQEAADHVPAEKQIVFRIGINLGEVHVIDGDLFGDGVNVAARLESICPTGGICVSQLIKDMAGSDTSVQFEDFGTHRLKNVKVAVQAYLAAQSNPVEVTRAPEIGIAGQSPIRYCLSKDGTSIAHATVGEGYPLVFAGSWMTHLEWDWEAPSTRDYVSHLSRQFRVIRYAQRGNGM